MKKITILNQSRSLVLALLMLVVSSSAFAQKCTKGAGCEDSVVYELIFNYGLNGVEVEQADYSKKVDLLNWAKANTEPKICIKGWADATGSESTNKKVSGIRANNLGTYLINNGVDANRITVKAMGVDTKSGSADQARRVNVVGYTTKPCTANESADMKKIEEKLEAIEAATAANTAATEKLLAAQEEAEVEAVAVEAAAVEAAAIAAASSPETFSLRTNLAYWCLGLINIGAEWVPEDSQWGYVLNAGYSPFSGETNNFNIGGWFISPEARYYIGESKSWFVGGQMILGGYDIKVFDFVSPLGRDGNVFALGVNGGYKFKLSDMFDMDINVGFGYTRLWYDVYNVQDDTRVITYENATKNFFLPMHGGINLIYTFK